MTQKSTKCISEELEKFRDFLVNVKKDYDHYYELVGKMDELTQDYLHDFEFGQLTYSERNKLGTKMHKCRCERRIAKDIVQELEPVVNFIDGNHNFTNRINELLGEVRKIEKSHINRHYNRRVDNAE
jgi:hypothetical protein